MDSIQASTILSSYTSSISYTSSRRTTTATLHVPKFPKARLSPTIQSFTTKLFLEDSNVMESFKAIPQDVKRSRSDINIGADEGQLLATTELYMILEAVADRVEMHNNIGEQRNNWNTLLLNSINMITLAATTMAGIAATTCSMGMPVLALKLSSTLLFISATGLLAVMNKIQPSQLAEEQRNASKLFKQLYNEIKTIIALRNPTFTDVQIVIKKVLALDKAYPLPLLGTMLEKFPKELKPARWWPSNSQVVHKAGNHFINGTTTLKRNSNGWNEELEIEMRNVAQVMRNKDAEDYVRLGNLALKLNKVLAISGPLLTGIAAIGSVLVGSPSHIGSCAVIAATVCGSLASVVNSLEHGGQVGMVFEMYRNCAGYFQQLEETIESTLSERQVERRENGELFEMKVAMQLGRSLSQLRELATKSSSCCRDGSTIDEFASKLF